MRQIEKRCSSKLIILHETGEAECEFFAENRRKMLDRNLFVFPNVLKFKYVMNLSPCNVKYTKFCKFVKEIIVKFK